MRLSDHVSNVCEAISAAALFSLICIVLVTVGLRDLLNIPSPWSDEVISLLHVWLVFMGYYAVVWKEESIAIDFLAVRFFGRWRWYKSLKYSICMILPLVLGVSGVLVIVKLLPDKLLIIRVPMFFVFIPAVICGFLLFIQYGILTAESIRSLKREGKGERGNS